MAVPSLADPDPRSAEAGSATDHELLRVFAEHGFPLNSTLREMLNEHYTHQTERRGAGFTQATRHLAVFVNRAARPGEAVDARMFLRRMDEAALRDALGALLGELEREESRILAGIILDLALPAPADGATAELRSWPDDLRIGTCPLAEKYFLELADAFVRRKGLVNVLVSETGEPLLLEKLHLGDDHSCISVAPVLLNGVRLPPGSLFGVRYEEGAASRRNRALPGEVIPVASCSGFRFLRLSTLAVSPIHRERAFTTHFRAQLAAGLFAPGDATIAQLRRVAEDQL